MSLVIPSTQPIVSGKLKRQAKGPRTRLGCKTCRIRKKRCDGGFPVCAHCYRLNYLCVREEPRVHRHQNFSSQQSKLLSNQDGDTPVRSLTESWLLSTEDKPAKTDRATILRYYVRSFCSILSTNLENNCFLSVFLPMALDSDMLMNVLLAWASSHLALKDTRFEEDALYYRCKSLALLRQSLSCHQRKVETSLAACLILLSLEVIEGNTRTWIQHLNGARELIRDGGLLQNTESCTTDSQPRKHSTFLTDTDDGDWLLQNFAYHDVIMSITCNMRPLSPGMYWQMDVDRPDPYIGLASGLLPLISDVSMLAADIRDSSFSPLSPSSSSYTSRLRSIEDELRDWRCPSSTNADLLAHAELYRSGALIYLYRIARKVGIALYAEADMKIQRQIAKVVDQASIITPHCLPECTLLFPLFIAAGEAYDTAQRTCLREKLTAILNTRHFRNVDVAITVLDETWRVRGEQGVDCGTEGYVDWEHILEKNGWLILLS